MSMFAIVPGIRATLRGDRRKRPQLESLEGRAVPSAVAATVRLPIVTTNVLAAPGGHARPVELAATGAPPVAKSGQHQADAANSNPADEYRRVPPSGAGYRPSAVAVYYPRPPIGFTPRLAVLNSDGDKGSVSILSGDGNGGFSRVGEYFLKGTPSAMALGMFLGDGLTDVAITQRSAGDVELLLQKPDGTFSYGQRFAAGKGPVAVTTASLTSAGNSDLIVADAGSNEISTLLSNNNGTFGQARGFPAGVSPSCLAVGDFNQGGKLDVAVGSVKSKDVQILIGNGDGTFQAPEPLYVGFDVGSIATADLLKNGKTDLVVGSAQRGLHGRAEVFWGNGAGGFKRGPTIRLDGGPSMLVTGVLAGNSYYPGIVASIPATGQLDLIANNGNGSFRGPYPVYAGSQPVAVAFGKLIQNVQFTLDLVTANQHGNDVGVLVHKSSSKP
jgi:hypothetical protein